MTLTPDNPSPENIQIKLKSTHSINFPQLLARGNVSLVVSTYQAGQLIVFRTDEMGLNTHFVGFKKPMGLAANRTRIALGTQNAITEFYNMPSAAAKLEPTGKYDSCYLHRNTHITGNIDIHEMDWAGEELWFVNTRFSCLCTIDPVYSFQPRWQPPFISKIAPEDRCHLNGLAVVGDRPKYVTALGETNEPRGWRGNKANGGILIDVETNEIICRGLSMPHSPRWYREKLWVLESGNGSLATVDLATGKLETVATFPGFTRGLVFAGNLAFIGLSQVRETAIFSGLPLTDRLEERISGVWVVNIDTGKIVAYSRFDGSVREIFGVGLLPQTRFPEILPGEHEILDSSYALSDEVLKKILN